MKLPMMRPRMSVARRSFLRATRFLSRSLSSGVDGAAAAAAAAAAAPGDDLLPWLLRPHLNPFTFDGDWKY